MTSNTPFVSVIIPCRNEERYIKQCLESIMHQDYPKDLLEILVIDGMSEDATRAVVSEFSQNYPHIKLLENKGIYTPLGLNVGIRNSKGEVIVRMDSHAVYQHEYISKCIRYLNEYKVDNVGGVIETKAAEDTVEARSIAAVLSSSFGAASKFRLGSNQVVEVDTVFGGCYRKDVFSRVGLFDERMIRSQDIELNKRLKKAGGKIILVPDVKAVYFPKAYLQDFFWHNFKDGFWVTYPLKFGVKYFSLRHLFPLILVSSLIITFILGIFSIYGKLLFIVLFVPYVLAVFYSVISLSIQNKLSGLPLLMAVLYRHFGYGLGSIWGLIKLCVR